jgi:ribonuclease HII
VKKKKSAAPKKQAKASAKSSAKKKKPVKKATTKKKATQSAFPDFADDEDPAVMLARTLGEDAVVAGLDEAGRGPLAGPVVAAAVVLPVPLPDELKALNDSKQLEPEEREALYPLIVKHAVAYGVAVSEVDRIDEINILRASLEAMSIAFERCAVLLGKRIAGAVIDGNLKAPLPFDVTQRTVIGGDALSRPIMAASILAKVTRDRRMIEEHARYPGYGFDAHKGYATPQHTEALQKLGPCPQHRRSFAPITALLPPGTRLPRAALSNAAALAALAKLGISVDDQLAALAAERSQDVQASAASAGAQGEMFGPIDPMTLALEAE